MWEGGEVVKRGFEENWNIFEGIILVQKSAEIWENYVQKSVGLFSYYIGRMGIIMEGRGRGHARCPCLTHL